MDTFDYRKSEQQDGGEEVYSNVIKAGRRKYFFDVKATRNDDYYITITESRKKIGKDGETFYDKHKVYLYKEDFDKFADGLADVIKFVKTNKPEFFEAVEGDTGGQEDSIIGVAAVLDTKAHTLDEEEFNNL